MALCIPTDNNVIQNCFRKNIYFRFFLQFFFNFIIMRVYNHWWIIPNQSSFFKENKFQWKYIFSENFFFFLSSFLRTPTDKNVVQKISWKMIFIETIFSKLKRFLQHSCETPLVIFTGNFKELFSWIFFSLTKKRYSEDCFSLCLCYSVLHW